MLSSDSDPLANADYIGVVQNRDWCNMVTQNAANSSWHSK